MTKRRRKLGVALPACGEREERRRSRGKREKGENTDFSGFLRRKVRESQHVSRAGQHVHVDECIDLVSSLVEAKFI